MAEFSFEGMPPEQKAEHARARRRLQPHPAKAHEAREESSQPGRSRYKRTATRAVHTDRVSDNRWDAAATIRCNRMHREASTGRATGRLCVEQRWASARVRSSD
jgi:hypothetical protein